jgi:hypothetical protein
MSFAKFAKLSGDSKRPGCRMADDRPKRLTPTEAKAKAEECRAMARVAIDRSHRVMLASIAQTWERIAETAHEAH